jgi:hypothetical protein
MSGDSPVVYCLFASSFALAYWMSIELFALAFILFKRYTSAYFWSIIFTTLGIILYTTGTLLINFENPLPPRSALAILEAGWVLSTTGFSLVLWSRLHCVLYNSRVLKGILVIILLNGLVCHTATIALLYESLSKPDKSNAQNTTVIFVAQETVLSSLYIYYTSRLWKSGPSVRWRRVVSLAVSVQILVIILDATALALFYTHKHAVTSLLIPLFKAIDLRCEFIVLNQLQRFINRDRTLSLNIDSGLPIQETQSHTSLPTDNRSLSSLPLPTCFAPNGIQTAVYYPRLDTSILENNTINGYVREDPGQTMVREEKSLRNDSGQPLPRDSFEDLQTLYLGRWAEGE